MTQVRYTDRGWAELHSRFGLGRESATYVKAGVVGSLGQQRHLDSDLTVEEVGILQEFGTDTIPARSFLRDTMRQARNKVTAISSRIVGRVVMNGVPSDVALRELGQWATDEIRRKIFSGVDPANAPSTVEKKGHGMTLRDSFTLANAIGYEIISGVLGLLGSSSK